jgi:amino acid adenylation domain-containing protein
MAPDGLAARFAETARRYPSRIALVTSSGRVTYRELLADAERLARALADPGTGSPVAITVSRTRASITAILGTILAGLPYAPVDAAYPDSRLRFMLDDLAAAIHIDGTGREPVIQRSEPAARDLRIHPDALYVLYTSGSTGVPKGCVVTHRNALSLFDSTSEQLFERSDEDVSAVLHSFAFDVSVWEIWSAWLHGGTCWLADEETVRNPDRLSAGLESHHVTRFCSTPSIFAYQASAVIRRGRELPALRSVIIGGEPVRVPDVARFLSSGCVPNGRVFNIYGITETTVFVTFRELSGTETLGPSGSTPIGLPIPSLRLSLRDERGDLVEPGLPGEIWISGGGVSAGYLNRPELTAERFVTDRDGVNWYRSGDLGRYDSGEYHYLGRRDRQVQLHGYRIELGEVEAALETLDGVEQAIAVIETRPATGLPALVVYVQARAAHGAVTGQEIKDQARLLLPPHEVPQTVHLVPHLPLNQHGKLDMAELRGLTANRA